MTNYVAGVPLVHLNAIKDEFERQGTKFPEYQMNLEGWHIFGGEHAGSRFNPIDPTALALRHGIPSWMVVFNKSWSAPFCEIRWFHNREAHMFAQDHIPTPESYQTKEVLAYKIGMHLHPIEMVNAAAAAMAYHLENGLGDQVQLGHEYRLWRMLRGDYDGAS